MPALTGIRVPLPLWVVARNGVKSSGMRCSLCAVVSACLVLLAGAPARAAAAAAQETPAARAADPPRPGFVVESERVVGGVTVVRWVNGEAREVSPAGMCECVIVVHIDGRPVLTLGDGGIAAISVHEMSGRDINGDGVRDVIVDEWSGGTHCCYSTTVHALEATPRRLLALEPTNCGPAEPVDLDGDGRFEFVTCDDRWQSDDCSFAESPMPRVVLAYDDGARVYRPATPRFPARFRDELAAALRDAQQDLANPAGRSAGRDRCAVLRPALALMYLGRVTDGVALIRGLYRHPDREAFEQRTLDTLRSSPLWTAGSTPR